MHKATVPSPAMTHVDGSGKCTTLIDATNSADAVVRPENFTKSHGLQLEQSLCQ